MVSEIPLLRILPADKLILHEDHDLQRTLPLVEKLRAQGILRNPPIVMPLQDNSGRYMVLDGANRVTSLQAMQFPHIVAQVVEPEDPNITLLTWNHVVWGMSMRALLTGLRAVENLNLQRVDTLRSINPPGCIPTLLRLADNRLLLGCTPSDLAGQVRALHGVVDAYKDKASFDRTSQTLVDSYRNIHPDLTALIIFPRFDVHALLELGALGLVLPTGITRFSVSPRALHLNYPLHELSSARPLQEKEAYLAHWISERIKHKGVRHYAEATFLFDE